MTDERLAVSIPEAAKMVSLSRAHFYRTYLDTGRVKTVAIGRRRMVVVSELRDAFAACVAEARAAQLERSGSV